jgi:beta-galactosidase
MSSLTQSAPVIGSQLFINRTTTPEEAAVWVQRMAEANFKLIRLFLIWDYLEPRPGEWVFETYDAVFAEADRLGLGVVPTLMSVSPPGWMLRSGGVQAVANLEDPYVVQEGERYIRKVVGHWQDHPALHSWILWNEASRIPSRSEATLSRYRKWLEEKFDGDVEAMNALQFRRYASFSEVGKTQEVGAMDLEFATFAEKTFWLEFSVAELNGHLARIRDVVREQDSMHPIHVNPHGLSFFVQHAGQSIWEEARTVDFLGCSSHPVWHSTRYDRSRWLHSLGIFADLMRASTPDPDGKFWVSELQGGMTRLSAMTADTPSPDELSRWMWAGIASGAKATVFWCFNWRDEGYEAGEWGLARWDGSPSPRLEAATRVANDLETYSGWFGPSRPWKPDVLILRSDAAERLAWAESRDDEDQTDPRNNQRVADSASGAALALMELGIETGYVEEKGLEARLKQEPIPKAILVPGLEVLSDGTLEALLAFVRKGGRVIADAAPGVKDPVGRIASWRFELWERLFGGALLDEESWRHSQQLPEDGEYPTDWWIKVVSNLSSGKAVHVRDDGTPLVWENCVGEGSVTLIGTWFFHRFLAGNYPLNRQWLGDQLLPHVSVMPIAVDQPDGDVILRHLVHPKGAVVVVLDQQKRSGISLQAQCAGRLHFSGGGHQEVQPGDAQTISLREDGVGFALFEM